MRASLILAGLWAALNAMATPWEGRRWTLDFSKGAPVYLMEEP